MPKEMLPIIDKHTIQYIVEEAVESGITGIIIVTGKGKRAIEDHFDNAFELEHNLIEKDKWSLLEEVRRLSKMVDIHYIRQKEPLGLGHAVWCARKFVGNEPFAVLLGDDIIQSKVPCLRQMIDAYERVESAIVAIQSVPQEEVQRYGIVSAKKTDESLYVIDSLVEKPKIEAAPSNLAIMGRYILTTEIFDILEEQQVGTGGEIQLTDAINRLSAIRNIYAYQFEGKRYDVGDKMGFINTTIEFALSREDLRNELKAYLGSLLESPIFRKGR
jgi:UTP--glucose-1-phosphate uridylyltransferase